MRRIVASMLLLLTLLLAGCSQQMLSEDELSALKDEAYQSGVAQAQEDAKAEAEAQYQKGYDEGQAKAESDAQAAYDKGYQEGYDTGSRSRRPSRERDRRRVVRPDQPQCFRRRHDVQCSRHVVQLGQQFRDRVRHEHRLEVSHGRLPIPAPEPARPDALASQE